MYTLDRFRLRPLRELRRDSHISIRRTGLSVLTGRVQGQFSATDKNRVHN